MVRVRRQSFREPTARSDDAMSVQTTITAEPAIGAPGQIYDSGPFHDIVSLIAQEDIPFGCAVTINGQYCELPDNSGEVTGQLGVAVKDASKPGPGVYTPTIGGYKAGDVVSVMKSGRIWVATETALANGAAPFVRFAAGAGGSQQGAWRNGADTASAVQPTTGVHVYRGVAAAGLAVIELGKTGD
jgi:hypothetical protein